ncbi:uncharacterized protein LOC127736559 [Mytilus californianus]|uniref:uncharacterized protein LOC127736559 n=1 Tax=Mytilus californianus TaxID=6549 RepID=UPI00224730E3|nr:uncharacterized protein LOC127736559 [Mytilus californianus]
MGPVQTVNFVTALNVPCISPNNLKSREREIGKTIEEYARTSCKKALEEEYLMNRNDRTNEEDTQLNKSLDVSFDGGWQKRGSGRSYNSTTGHATVIGNVSGKCLHFGLKSTDCRKCNYIDEKGDAREEHDCRQNYFGSSKAMEPALAVEMVKDIEEMGYMVNSLTMDDDTTTMARLRQEVDHDVIKRSDSNHFRKNFTGDLLQLHQKHKRNISTSVTDYFVKDMLYVIKQNKGDVENLKFTIDAIVPHAFGDHSLCSSWCGYIKDPIGYRHKSLPHGKDLKGEELQQDIQTVFSKYSDNTNKLANLGSSQSNESLNYIISTKAPKSKHFGGSQSLGYRVASAISQKNEGRNYVVEVNKTHSLSPGKLTSQQRERLNRKIKREKAKAATPAFKRKRRDKKGSRVRSVRSKEIREGESYRSAISSIEEESPDIEEIPSPAAENDDINLHLGNTATVFFDLETTGLDGLCSV